MQGQETSSRLVSRSQCSSPGATGISGLHSRRTRGDRHSSRVEAKKPALLSSRDGYLWELTPVNPVMRQWSAQNLILSPHPLHYVMGYALVGLLALGGAAYVLRRHDAQSVMLRLVGWSAVV